MSVVGFDFGNANCAVAIAKAGGIDVIVNEYSERVTPGYVAFNEKTRVTGLAAKNQSDVKNRIYNIKRFVGRRFDDPIVQQEIKNAPFKVVCGANGEVCFKVQYRNEEAVFNSEQILAMLLQDLRGTASRKLGTIVSDCVISVPSYFTDCQRHSVLNAAQICGLNCLKVMNETTAVALSYGLFKQDLPPVEEPSRNVAFVDVGHSALQVCVCAFNKGKVKVLSVASDPCLGGRDFDNRLFDLLTEELKKKPGIDVRSNLRASVRLMKEIDTLKKKLSALKNEIPLNIECLMDDKDVHFKYSQEQFEALCADLFTRAETPMQQALADSGLKLEDISSVEVVGGSTRTPALKELVKKVFGKEVSTTLNADEVVSRGCAVQCAMLSHSIKVRDIEIQDACTYPISIAWESSVNEEKGEMVIFSKHHTFPATKMLTLARNEPFKLHAYYGNDVKLPHTIRPIGEFLINGVQPTMNGDPAKVKVKVRVNQNGCFNLHSATMVEKLPTPPPSPKPEEAMEIADAAPTANAAAADAATPDAATNVNGEVKMDTTEGAETPVTSDQNATPADKPVETEKKPGENAPEEVKATSAKKKKSTKTTDLSYTVTQNLPTADQIKTLAQVEIGLLGQIEAHKQLEETRNSVEEYVYSLREAIYEKYQPYVDNEEQSTISEKLDETEGWIAEYEECDDKKVFVDKLAEIKSFGNGVEERYTLFNTLPQAFEIYGKTLMHYRKICAMYSEGNEMYDHLLAEDMKKVEAKVIEKSGWYDQQSNAFNSTKKTSLPTIAPTLIYAEKKTLEDFCNPIVNKQKPKVEPPKDEPAKDMKPDEAKGDEGKPAENTENSMDSDQAKADTPAATPANSNLDMEVD